MTIPQAVRELAETPDRYTVPTPGFLERFDEGSFVVLRAPAWAAVSGIRADDVEATVAAARELAGDRYTTWWVGPSAEPPDLVDRLRELGFREPQDRVAELVSMATVTPPEGDASLVRRVETFEEFEAAAHVRWEAFELPEYRREHERQTMASTFEHLRAADAAFNFVAGVDGRPAATGGCARSPRGLLLFGGCTAPWARGRGLYRALVRARWDLAVELGTPALVIQANPQTSAPILDRVGFQRLFRVRRLEDRG